MNSVEAERGKPRLLTLVGDRVCFHHYGPSTEKAYLLWFRFRHPVSWPETSRNDVQVRGGGVFDASGERPRVSASTHGQALSAILFLHKEVLRIEMPWMQEIARPRMRHRDDATLARIDAMTV